MISAFNGDTKTSFTSVIPVCVYVDGMQTFNDKNIRSACRQLSNILAGQGKGNNLNIINEFAKYDPDYKAIYGTKGYPKTKIGKKSQPSDYFRCICDTACSFIFTGAQAQKLKDLGKAVGAEQLACKARKIGESFDLTVAKRNYGFAIANFIRSKRLKVHEHFDAKTGEKYGAPVTLNINMRSNGKYGLTTFKMMLENISFTKTS